MNAIDIGVIVAYFVGITLFGCSFYWRKGADDSREFMEGGGRIPSWALALSIFATYVSSISFLALPAKAYLTNFNAFVLSLSIPVSGGIAAWLFVPYYRKVTSASAYADLERRFGPWARFYASGCFLVMQSVRSGMILFLLALLLKTMFGLSFATCILVTGVTTVVYSMLGGLKAVVWTDAIQSVILIAGTVVVAVILCCTLPQGLEKGLSQAWDAGKFSLGSFSLKEWGAETFWVTFFYGIFLNLQNFGIDQSYTQRYRAAKSTGAAVRSMFSGAMLYVPVSFGFMLIGTLLWIWSAQHPGVIPADVTARSDAVFPWFIVHRLPVGVAGLLVAAIIAAAMSTISGTLNSGATVFLEDYRKRFAKSAPSERSSVRFLRLATVGLGVFAICVAFAVVNVQSVLTTWWGLQSVLSGGMLGLFLLGFFAKRTTSAHAAVATVLGILTVLWITFVPKFLDIPVLLHVNLAIVLGTLVLVVSGACLSFRHQTRRGHTPPIAPRRP